VTEKNAKRELRKNQGNCPLRACATPKERMRKRNRLFLVLGIAELVALSACAPLSSRLLLFPPAPVDDAAPAQRVMIAHPEGAIETIRAVNPGAKAVVLRFYGNGAQATGADVFAEAQTFGAWPIELWGVNYPGYGKSDGGASLAGVARAAEIAFDEAQHRGLPIYVLGTSMGTVAALHVARVRAVSGLLLINPPPLRQLILGRYGWWNLWLGAGPVALGVPSSLDSVENAQSIKCSTVVITSEQDSVVPVTYQDRVFQALAGKKQRFTVPGADHNDAVPAETWNAAVRAFGPTLE
jgi:uncharacterized protein